MYLYSKFKKILDSSNDQPIHKECNFLAFNEISRVVQTCQSLSNLFNEQTHYILVGLFGCRSRFELSSTVLRLVWHLLNFHLHLLSKFHVGNFFYSGGVCFSLTWWFSDIFKRAKDFFLFQWLVSFSLRTILHYVTFNDFFKEAEARNPFFVQLLRRLAKIFSWLALCGCYN